MRKDVKVFLIKVAALSSPILFFTVFYFIEDPFKVLRKNYQFENYYDYQPYDLNREFVSTELLLSNKDKYQYDSYIMGSCLSYTYHAAEWKKYIDCKGEVFHYPAASETLYGINRKIRFLDSLELPINNCLLVLDASTLKVVDQRHDYMHASHPLLSTESEFIFHINMLKSFFSNMFCLQYLDYRLFGKVRPYMKNNFGVEKGDVIIKSRTNEFEYARYEREIRKDSLNYYNQRKTIFYRRNPEKIMSIDIPIIKEGQEKLLEEIAYVFKKNNTAYKIVLSPMYDQIYFNETDRKKLKDIFGDKNVHDFTGQNNLTNDISNYYDNFHYKPLCSRKILQKIYRE